MERNRFDLFHAVPARVHLHNRKAWVRVISSVSRDVRMVVPNAKEQDMVIAVYPWNAVMVHAFNYKFGLQ